MFRQNFRKTYVFYHIEGRSRVSFMNYEIAFFELLLCEHGGNRVFLLFREWLYFFNYQTPRKPQKLTKELDLFHEFPIFLVLFAHHLLHNLSECPPIDSPQSTFLHSSHGCGSLSIEQQGKFPKPLPRFQHPPNLVMNDHFSRPHIYYKISGSRLTLLEYKLACRDLAVEHVGNYILTRKNLIFGWENINGQFGFAEVEEQGMRFETLDDQVDVLLFHLAVLLLHLLVDLYIGFVFCHDLDLLFISAMKLEVVLCQKLEWSFLVKEISTTVGDLTGESTDTSVPSFRLPCNRLEGNSFSIIRSMCRFCGLMMLCSDISCTIFMVEGSETGCPLEWDAYLKKKQFPILLDFIGFFYEILLLIRKIHITNEQRKMIFYFLFRFFYL